MSLKRKIDISITLIFSVIWIPLLAIVAIFIYLIDGPPILFRQLRTGFRNKPFVLVKFRTMKPSKVDKLQSNSRRITNLGRFLRVTSLDELPSFWNVLNGDMSLVGPRPLPAEYLPKYNTMQRKRHLVKPGLTGWAQIHGRNAISWEQKFEMDLWYVKKQSIWLDFKILFKTVPVVLNMQNITANRHQTMPVFDGNNE